MATRILVVCVTALVALGCGKGQLDGKPTAQVESPEAPGSSTETAKPEAEVAPPTETKVEAPATKDTPKAPVNQAKPKAPILGDPVDPNRADPLEDAPRDLVLDARRSSVAFVGRKITGEHEGSFEEIEGTATLQGYLPTSMKLTVHTGSLVADHPDLTNHLKGPDFFNAAKYPSARFATTKVRPGAEGTATHTITGELSLLAVTKRITFPAMIVVTDAGATGLAEFKINRKDFGIVYPGRPDDLIADEVLLKLNLAFLDKKYVR